MYTSHTEDEGDPNVKDFDATLSELIFGIGTPSREVLSSLPSLPAQSISPEKFKKLYKTVIKV